MSVPDIAWQADGITGHASTGHRIAGRKYHRACRCRTSHSTRVGTENHTLCQCRTSHGTCS
eukprot:1314282-Rhodomonas_salina.1